MHQHWVYTSLGRSCAVASLLLPGLRGEENFRRGFRVNFGLPPRCRLEFGEAWRNKMSGIREEEEDKEEEEEVKKKR